MAGNLTRYLKSRDPECGVDFSGAYPFIHPKVFLPQQGFLIFQVGGLQYEMTGFHGKRSEFDHEYDNDAELLISELEFPPTDTQVPPLSRGARGFILLLDLIYTSLQRGHHI